MTDSTMTDTEWSNDVPTPPPVAGLQDDRLGAVEARCCGLMAWADALGRQSDALARSLEAQGTQIAEQRAALISLLARGSTTL